jgi:hypothetical protein
MNTFLLFLGTLVILLAGLVASAVGGMVQDEIRTRLTRIPYGVLCLAALLVPANQRDDLRAEWRAEVSAIFEETKDVPFTGLVRATWYALGLLARGHAVARELDGTATERRRQLLDLLTRIKHVARVLAGQLGDNDPRRQVMTVSTPAGTVAIPRRAALAASAALAAAAAGITASVLVGSSSPFGSGGAHTGWNPLTVSTASVAFSPDGKLLATVFDGTARLWDVATGRPVEVALVSGSAVAGVAFSPDDKILATINSHGTVQLWKVATGRPLGQARPGRGRPWTGVRACSSQALSPDGKILAIQKQDGTVELRIEPRAAQTDSFPAGCKTSGRPFRVIHAG